MQLKEITLKDKALFDDYLSRFKPLISELTFSNLFSWKSKGYKFIEIGDHLLIGFEGNKKFLQPIGEDPSKIIRKILGTHGEIAFERVEERIALELTGLKVSEQEDMDDYVYDVSELSALAGRKFEPKRNLAKQCEKYDPDICPLDEDYIHHFFELQRRWFNFKSCECDIDIAHENEAIVNALQHWKEFNLIGTCVLINDEIAGFAVGERLNDDTFVEHFEKGDVKFKGIYQYTLREFAKTVPAKYLNREQDLGIDGLRKSKQSYNPVKMIKKYKIVS